MFLSCYVVWIPNPCAVSPSRRALRACWASRRPLSPAGEAPAPDPCSASRTGEVSHSNKRRPLWTLHSPKNRRELVRPGEVWRQRETNAAWGRWGTVSPENRLVWTGLTVQNVHNKDFFRIVLYWIESTRIQESYKTESNELLYN